jgi:hypothetical protein
MIATAVGHVARLSLFWSQSVMRNASRGLKMRLVGCLIGSALMNGSTSFIPFLFYRRVRFLGPIIIVPCIQRDLIRVDDLALEAPNVWRRGHG